MSEKDHYSRLLGPNATSEQIADLEAALKVEQGDHGKCEGCAYKACGPALELERQATKAARAHATEQAAVIAELEQALKAARIANRDLWTQANQLNEALAEFRLGEPPAEPTAVESVEPGMEAEQAKPSDPAIYGPPEAADLRDPQYRSGVYNPNSCPGSLTNPLDALHVCDHWEGAEDG